MQFPASAAKSTSGKQEDLCRRGSKNPSGIDDPPNTQASAVSEHAHESSHYPIWNEPVKYIDRDLPGTQKG